MESESTSGNLLLADFLSLNHSVAAVFRFSELKRHWSLCTACSNALLPYKVAHFVWLVTKEACLTQENLGKGGSNSAQRCYLSTSSN